MKISEINKRKAYTNIVNKIEILTFLTTEEGIRLIHLGFNFPKSLRQFNNWELQHTKTSGNDSLRSISKNANDTLRNYIELKNKAETLIHKLNLISTKPTVKADRIFELKKTISEHKSYIETLERHTAGQQLKIKELTELLKISTLRFENIVNELRKANQKP